VSGPADIQLATSLLPYLVFATILEWWWNHHMPVHSSPHNRRAQSLTRSVVGSS
jgi:hypothetical protein